ELDPAAEAADPAGVAAARPGARRGDAAADPARRGPAAPTASPATWSAARRQVPTSPRALAGGQRAAPADAQWQWRASTGRRPPADARGLSKSVLALARNAATTRCSAGRRTSRARATGRERATRDARRPGGARRGAHFAREDREPDHCAQQRPRRARSAGFLR